MEPGPARRTEQPLVVDPSMAAWAVRDRLDLVEERLFREGSLVDVADPLVGADDPVDDHRQHEEHRGEQDDEAGREIRCDRVVRAALKVAERPIGRGEPQPDDVDRSRLQPELDDGITEESADRRSDRREDLLHRPGASLPRAMSISVVPAGTAGASGAV